MAKALNIFFFISPFLFCIQVVLQRKDIVIIPYFFVLLVLLAGFCKKSLGKKIDSGKTQKQTKRLNIFDSSVLIFMALNIMLLGHYILFVANYPRALSLFVTFIFPLFIYFWIIYYYKDKDFNILFFILMLTVSIVCIEYLYEYIKYNIFHEGITWYRQQYIDYLFLNFPTGANADYFYSVPKSAVLRTTGLFVHPHELGVFIGLGILYSFSNFLVSKKKIMLFFLFLFSFTLIIISVRTAFFGVLFALVVIYLIRPKKFLRKFNRSLMKIILITLIILFIISLLWFRLDYILERHVGIFSSPVIQVSKNYTFVDVIYWQIDRYTEPMKNNPMMIFTGEGFGELRTVYSGDLGFTSLMSRFGLFGLSLFLILFFVFIVQGIKIVRLYAKKNIFIKYPTLLFAIGVGLLYVIQLFHSGAILTRATYPWLFVSFAIIRKTLYDSKLKKSKDVQPEAIKGFTKE